MEMVSDLMRLISRTQYCQAMILFTLMYSWFQMDRMAS